MSNKLHIVHTPARVLGLEILFRPPSEQKNCGGAAEATSGKS